MTFKATEQKIYAVRDTACGADVVWYPAMHAGDALARLAALCIGMQRISFEMYEIGSATFNETGHFTVVPAERLYICSATQAMLDSYFEDAEEVLGNEEDIPNGINPA